MHAAVARRDDSNRTAHNGFSRESKPPGGLLLDVGPERLEHLAAGGLAVDAGDLRQGGGERHRLEDALAGLRVFFSFGGTLFALQVCVILFSESHTMDFPENRNPPGVGHLLLLGGVPLARRDRRLALVLALAALAAHEADLPFFTFRLFDPQSARGKLQVSKS